MHQIVSPIYKMDDTEANKLTKTVFFALWGFVQYRLGRFDMFIDDFKDIMSGKISK